MLSIWEDETQEDHKKFEVLHHIIILTNQEMMITEKRNPKKKLTCSSFHLEGLVGSCQIGTLAAPPWASSVLFFHAHKKTQFLGHFLCTTSTNTNHFRWGGSAKQTQSHQDRFWTLVLQDLCFSETWTWCFFKCFTTKRSWTLEVETYFSVYFGFMCILDQSWKLKKWIIFRMQTSTLKEDLHIIRSWPDF